jgi:FG-GAP-like repeat
MSIKYERFRLIALTALSFLAVFAEHAPAQTTLFAPRRDFPAGGDSQAIVVADFNRDGISDVVTADLRANTISVLLGNGDGTLRPALSMAASLSLPRALTVGDFNSDGVPDLAVGGSQGVSIFLGNGDGTFQLVGTFAVGGQPASGLAAGDFNRDGALDLAVVSGQQAVFVLLGRGDGAFQAAQSFPADGSNNVVSVADLNRDGALDIVTVSSLGHLLLNSSTTSVLFGNGDGTFQPAQVFFSGYRGTFPGAIEIVDFNGDGTVDLLVLNNDGDGGSVISLHVGNGDGTFQPARRVATGKDFRGLAVSDFDGDGKRDLAVTNNLSGPSSSVFALWVLRGNGDGTVQAPLSFEATNFPGPVAVGDFNADGSADLVAANVGPTVSLYLNNTESFWVDMANVIPTGNSLRKTSGCDGCFDASATSRRQVTGSGYAEFTAVEAPLLRMGGLARVGAGSDCEDIDFGIRLQGGIAEVRENRVYRADTTFVTGDVFRITVQANEVTYAKNGVVFYTSAATAFPPFVFVGVLANLEATVNNVVIVAGQ